MAITFDRSLRVDPDQYIGEEFDKDFLVLHHTVGGSARSTFDWWQHTPERVATAFIIERNGTIYEVFEPACWAYHLGKGIAAAHCQRSVGIEIASEGPLKKVGDKFFWNWPKFNTPYHGEVYDHGKPWRDYRYYAAYTPAQLDAVMALVDYLCDTFGIPRRTPANHFDFNEDLLEYEGVIGHHHVRRDKSDVHAGFPWARLVGDCRLTLT